MATGKAARAFSAATKQEFKRAALKIDKLASGMAQKTPDAVRMIGEDIMFDVKASRPGAGVPVDTGVLRSSGQVEGPTGIKGDVILSFGGAAAPYALVQHENTQFAHKVGEARYLVRGVERWQPHGASAQRARAELQQVIDKLAVSKKARRQLRKHI